MRISTLIYCINRGFKNIGKNRLFSVASIATISACIFLFCLFYSIIDNFQYIIERVETTIGITVFFDENLTERELKVIGDEIGANPNIMKMVFISADEAWENFKGSYFLDMENLAEGFAEDNPLAGSASYEIFLNDISFQTEFVELLNSTRGVRRVNFSSAAVSGLSNFSKMVGYLSAVVIGLLLAVSIFLITNTISMAITVRKEEIKIMRLIGATNFMIRAPFVVEGVMIGIMGTIIPLVSVYFVYEKAVEIILDKFGNLSEIIVFLPIVQIAAVIIPVSLALGAGIGLLGSLTATRKHLNV
jgi:Cell division protein